MGLHEREFVSTLCYTPRTVWLPLLLIVPATVLALVVIAGRNDRDKRLTEMRSRWGKPRKRKHKMDAIAESHQSRIAHCRTGMSLNSRTWTDLDLDAVFEAIERTESTVGQHALYHRLRTAPIVDHLDAFEALVERMGADASTRERAQLGLSRLQDESGYDLWWMFQPNILEVRPWYIVFPILSSITLMSLLILPFWHRALVVVIAAIGLSVAIRLSTDKRIGAVTGAFRLLAPLITGAQALTFLHGNDI